MEYAIETVRRGSIALGIKTKNGVILAAEEKTKKLQISKSAQKIFQIDNHIGVVAAGYIPDARSQADNARFFSQSNRLVYDEPVEVESLAKHLADQAQQYTQYAGVRLFGVALIIGGITQNNPYLFLTDPSGTYIQYNAISIGENSDQVQNFLEKSYQNDLSLDDAAVLATAAIINNNEISSKQIKMAQITSEKNVFEILTDEKIKQYVELAKTKYPKESK